MRRNNSNQTDNIQMRSIDFDSYGVAKLPHDLLDEVFGGDVTVLAPLVVISIFHPVNAVCPSATVPAPVNEQVNVLCMMGLNPPGTNLGCTTHDRGTNPVCFTNHVC